MKNKNSTTKTSKQKVTIYNMSYNNIANNSTNQISSTNNNNNQQQSIDKNAPFPIWEKVYLEPTFLDSFLNKKLNNIDSYSINTITQEKDLITFFKESKSINIDNYIYIFPLFKSEYKYAIIDLEKTQIIFHEMPFQCFNPIYNSQYYFSIFLFTYDNSHKGDGKYDIVEYDIKTNIFNILPSKGVAPKARNENFCSFLYLNKIYFFGGIPQFISDNSMHYLFSYNLKEYDWKIEEYNIMFQKELLNNNYIGNNYDISCVQIEDKNIFYLIGGKYYDDIIYTEISNINYSSKLKQPKESYEIIKLQINENSIELSNHKKSSKNKFGYALSVYYKENIYIYNKDNLFLFDIKNQEISLLKKRLFSPEIEGHGSFFIYNKYLYLIGKFLYYDDCFIFRTNIDKINNKYTGNQKTNYEYLLNWKDNKDNNKDNEILCYFNYPDDKKLYLNKLVLSNFSLYMKKLLTKTNLNLFDINYHSLKIILKWIYNNFDEMLCNNLTSEIYRDIFNILLKYNSKCLLNIFIPNIKLNNSNCMTLYEIGNILELNNLKNKCFNYISENLTNNNNNKGNDNLIFSENSEIKKKILENYFCKHKIYIECDVININVRNFSKVIVPNEKVDYLKELNKNGKLFYCLNCNKVFIPNN